jgi:exopolyphosphatase/guanosine-5'-triphosphate,3'-diphosphate pyrophosphatase
VGEQRGSDAGTIRLQLGREPSVPFVVAARCPGGHPLVIRNRPYDADGKPFPTLFWLTCPEAAKRVSRLESDGWIGRFNERAGIDESFAAALDAAHAEYARERARTEPAALALGGVGGSRTGVKCLHAHYANHLAGGDDPVGAWVAGEVEPIHDESPVRVAAVDLGTNSIRLLVAAIRDDGELDEFARDMVITRIGKGVDRTGAIDPEALGRTVEVLARYCGRARALHAERIRVSATSAVRDASNRADLEGAVRALAGSELEVISGEKEAELSFLGSTRELEAPAPFLVVDIGGGSTEFALGTAFPEAAISTSVGSVRLTERFVRHDPPAPEELEAAGRLIATTLAEVEGAIRVRDAATLVAVAGTATTVQAICLGLTAHDAEATHRTTLTVADAERILGELARMTNVERAAIPIMPPGRGDVIVCGALILVEMLRRFGFERAIVSETDLLDGLVFEMLGTR